MPDVGDLVNAHNYFDLQFGLLHEDAIRDLRNGVRLMRDLSQQFISRKDLMKRARDATIKLHDQLTVSGLQAIDGVACVQFRLVTNKSQFLDWRVSKKLMPGSLVILSHDNFQTLFVGIMKNRDPRLMNQTHQWYGYVHINIQIVKTNIGEMSIVDYLHSYSTAHFQMIESSAYFESYIHVLKSMQRMDRWRELPFHKLIVNGMHDQIRMPPYMAQIVQENGDALTDEIQAMGLDKSQQNAMVGAITSNLALIQGPPGTGKTYIGVQLVKLLLDYKENWKKKGPILLVTYTNHALNQFIRHIMDFTKNIIRIGGKAPDLELEQFGLRNKLFQMGNGRAYGVLRRKIDNIQKEIALEQQTIETYQTNYIHTFIEETVIETNFDKLKRSQTEIEQILQALRQHFPRELKQALSQHSHEKNYKEFCIFAENEIGKLRKVTRYNILFIFWLGIIDLDKFLYNLYPIYEEQEKLNHQKKVDDKGKHQEQEKDLQEDEDLMEERERDYMIYINEQYSINDRLQTLQADIYDAVYPQNISPDFGSLGTLQECISFGSQFQNLNEEQFTTMLSETISAPFDMEFVERWDLNNYIINSLKQRHSLVIDKLVEEYQSCQESIEELDIIGAQKIFEKADIIAMTTTGRSKYSAMLKDVNFPIVIVEEAAEVFEAHIITSLTRQTEHLILIGDHEQLKPNPAVYELSHNYNLSMSMFERLINNKIPHNTLAHQRRMRPEISKMMNLIYPTLQNHTDVLKYPNVKGMKSNLYFYDHNFVEKSNDLMISKLNQSEGDMVVRFACYLLQNEYRPERITILTLYAGQLLYIKQQIKDYTMLQDQLSKIRVVNVDNYQGEENDIILLSLVRSNAENNIGFLKISNRVCVALSRAREGLFIFGNSNCLLGSKLKLWEDVVNYLKDHGFFGNTLQFKCKRHNTITHVKDLEDFQKIPKGGCSELCGLRMECGHKCELVCHYYEETEDDRLGHSYFKCQKTCVRERPCQHPCTYKCHQCKKQHQPCGEFVEKIMTPCNHKLKLTCHETLTKVNCDADCEKIRLCGHKCTSPCFVQCERRPCKITVVKKMECSHEAEMDCFQDPKNFKCFMPCNTILPCGHICLKKCGDCKEKGEHGLCEKKCGKSLICSHLCKQKCVKNCPPCRVPSCNTECEHSQCSLSCGEVCNLCMENCTNQCVHSKCTKLCSQPCDRKPCEYPCEKLLDCKHPCIGLCGEDCPKVCRICQPGHETFETFFGNESEETSRFVQIDCGHIFEVKAMDKNMNLIHASVKYKQCPRCKSLINKCKRYRNQINQTLNDINTIKGIIIEKNRELEERIKQTIEDIANVKKSIIHQKMLMATIALKIVVKQEQRFEQARLNGQIDVIKEIQSDLYYANQLNVIVKIIVKHQKELSKERLDAYKALRLQVHSADQKPKIPQNIKDAVSRMYNDFIEVYPVESIELQSIIQAVGLSTGHWNKCPNGHFYVIGDCGGAMEESKCPDCGAVIGGADHNLAAGNQHASELGGRPAWDPTGFDANVQNGAVDINAIAHD